VDPGGWIEQTIIWKYDPSGYDPGWHLSGGTYRIRGAFEHYLNPPSPSYILETPSITFVIE